MKVQKEKAIVIADEILKNHLTLEEIADLSITVHVDKPAKDERNCCEPGNGCC